VPTNFSAVHEPVLYLQGCSGTLYLNIFRGEPAISGFDRHFTTIHNSSPSFATLVCSALPTAFRRSSAWPWIDHPVSGLPHFTNRAINTRFPYASALKKLELAKYDNSLAHSAKGTPW